ncbi:MAG TPA: insulinase family protein [Bacteriovoracaceae bacterium]|nr:insulinase family protein [Bacteriovoracaceae bacterium]
MKYLFLSLFFVAGVAEAKSTFLDSINRTKWGDLEVVWIEDSKFPRFTASIMFQDGAITDPVAGLTQATLDLFASGTSKENQRELSEFFDFYGANIKHTVTHEYSVMSVQALTKDITPVISKVCEIFKDARFPEDELNSYVSRSKSHLRNLVTSHSALADRIYRNLSLKNTAYDRPVEGTLLSFEKMTSTLLKERLDLLNRTKKVLYISGPPEIKAMKNILGKNCNWSNQNNAAVGTLKKPTEESVIYLAEVPGDANQAQIRIGRYLTLDEVKGKHDQFQFLSTFLGGGFTSKLVQELRVKRGLTYSAGAYVSMQRDYGRAGIITFSKNETTAEAISIIRDVFAEVGAGLVSKKEFEHQQNHLIGGYAFGFEETTAFLGQIMQYDHQGRDLKELVNFPQTIKNLTPTSLSQASYEVFPWERMTILVLGDKSLVKSLSRIRPVKIINYEDFL